MAPWTRGCEQWVDVIWTGSLWEQTSSSFALTLGHGYSWGQILNFHPGHSPKIGESSSIRCCDWRHLGICRHCCEEWKPSGWILGSWGGLANNKINMNFGNVGGFEDVKREVRKWWRWVTWLQESHSPPDVPSKKMMMVMMMMAFREDSVCREDPLGPSSGPCTARP